MHRRDAQQGAEVDGAGPPLAAGFNIRGGRLRGLDNPWGDDSGVGFHLPELVQGIVRGHAF